MATREEVRLRARLKEATRLLERFAKWHRRIPDEPPWPAGSQGRLVQQVRAFVKAQRGEEG